MEQFKEKEFPAPKLILWRRAVANKLEANSEGSSLRLALLSHLNYPQHPS